MTTTTYGILYRLVLPPLLIITKNSVAAFTIHHKPLTSTATTITRNTINRLFNSINDNDNDSPATPNGEVRNDNENYDDTINNPFQSNGIPAAPLFPMRPTKGKESLYDEDELKNLLATHLNLQDELMINDDNEPSSLLTNGDTVVGGLENFSIHDMVMQAIATRNDDDKPLNDNDNDTPQPSLTTSPIRAIATDVDGTLIGSHSSTIHPRTISALTRACHLTTTSTKQLTRIFLATGKSRAGAIRSLGPSLGPLFVNRPGVYLQGLYCVGSDGHVVYERRLTNEAVMAAVRLARDEEIDGGGVDAVVAYDGDSLYYDHVTTLGDDEEEKDRPRMVTLLHELYGEPLPERTSLLESSSSRQYHKLLLMDENISKIQSLRPHLEQLALQYDACVTQALPTMLEWLPKAASKGHGVRELCRYEGIDPERELLALGDAENDVEMLRMARVGVAMGNACDLAKGSADVVMSETSDEGGAGMAMERLLFEMLNEESSF